MSNNYNYYYFSFFHYFGFEARSELPIIRYVYRRFQSHREVPFIPILTRNEIKSRRERNSPPNSLSLSKIPIKAGDFGIRRGWIILSLYLQRR